MDTIRALAVVLVLAVLSTGCGGEQDAVVEESTTTTTTALTTTTTVLETPTTVPSPSSFETERVGLTWATPSVEPEVVGVAVQATTGQEWAMTLVHPIVLDDRSDLPIVVYFHGSTSGTPLNGLDQLAEQGAVVVVPRWILPEWNFGNLGILTEAEYADGYWFDVAACAYAAAQDAAVKYGGDPTATTLVGFSAGIHPAAWVTLTPPRNDLCPERDSVRPEAMVIGDSQLLFQGPGWDETFEDPNSLALDTVDRLLNPKRWTGLPDDFAAYLWSTESTLYRRELEDPSTAESWIRTRSTEPEVLIDDLRAVGAYDDGAIMFDDNALLLEKRLGDAGFPVLHETFPTNHAYTAGVHDRIGALVAGEELVATAP